MKTGPAFLARHPRWVVFFVIALGLAVSGASLYPIAIQIGGPFPGFFYTPDRIVSSYTPHEYSGWQAGLRPWDRILAVDGQHPDELSRLVQKAGIGGTVIYTVERAGQTLKVAVPTMEYTVAIPLRFCPAFFFYTVACFAIGLFVYSRNPGSRLGQYLLMYLVIWGAVTGPINEYFQTQQKWSAWVFHPWIAAICVAGWIFFWSFPADRARSQLLARWPLLRTFALFGIILSATFTVLYAVALGTDQPWAWRLYTLTISWVAFVLLAGGSAVIKSLPLLRIIWRKEADSRIRRQALVLLVGITIGLGGITLFAWVPFGLHLSPPGVSPWYLGGFLGIAYPLAIGYAVLRYQLFDIQVVIRKGLVYSLLTATLTAAFVLLSVLSGYLFQVLTGGQSLVVFLLPALFVAFLFQPARSRIQTVVDRAFFRREYEVRQTLTAFGLGLSTLRERDEVVRLVLDTVVETLGAGGADLWLREGEQYLPARTLYAPPLPASGSLATRLASKRRPFQPIPEDTSPPAQALHQAEAAVAVPLFSGQELAGFLTLGAKRSGEVYSDDDLALLSGLAHSASLALENARLHEERLAILRQQLVQVTAAQEEERQRIARELHDGVGPALASMNLRLRTARKLLDRDQDAAARELEELAELSQDNVRDIRRMIYDLRPAALDELGLVPALRQYLNRCQREHDLQIGFSANQAERLPAPVETALFRIVQEAVNNVVKHAGARRVEVTLAQDDGFVALAVADDGQGFDPAAPRSGQHVGLWSMRERVVQLGGRFELQSGPGQGTVLNAWLPLETMEG
jgi:signal transduction histidine kinase